MKSYPLFLPLLFATLTGFSQSNKVYVIQDGDTLDVSRGLTSYSPLQISWSPKVQPAITEVDVVFGNGMTAYSAGRHTIPYGQYSFELTLDKFVELEEAAVRDKRHEPNTSRILIIPRITEDKFEGVTKPFSLQIAFKLRQ